MLDTFFTYRMLHSKRPATQPTPLSPKRQKLHEDILVAGMSPLERLPRELLWKVIDNDLDGLHKFRQVLLIF